MEIQGLGFLLLIWATWTLLGLSTTLTLTITLGHNRQPFISDTAVGYPERIVYEVVFLGTSFLGAVICYLQYKFMLLRSGPSSRRFIIWQKILLTCVYIAHIGTAVNAIYTIMDNALVHRIGAGAAFLFGTIYNISQAALVYKRTYRSRCLSHVGLATSLLTAVVLLLFCAGQGSFYIGLCTGRCETILYLPVLVAEYVAFIGMTLQPVTSFADFQHLSVKMNRKGIEISLRVKNSDPEYI